MIKTKKNRTSYFLLLIFLIVLRPASSFAQNFSSDLYLQTSEVNNTMVHYEADKGSIMRFYATNSNADTFGVQYNENNYNTPERRNRRLQLISDYKKTLEGLNFDAMNINGKVDYILFNRNLNSEEYELLQQQKVYDKIKAYFPFDEKIYALEKPRRRGIKVNGELVAKELEDLRKVIKEQIKKVEKIEGLDKTSSEFAVLHAKGLQEILKNYFDFYNGYDPLFSWWVPKTYSE